MIANCPCERAGIHTEWGLPNIFVIAVLALLIATGCKPKEQVIANQVVQEKEAMITGQIFIVTKARENIVLGDEKVALLDAKELKAYLNSKITEWSNALEAAQAKVNEASANVSLAESNFASLYKADIEKYTTAKRYHAKAMDSAPVDSQQWQDAYDWSKKVDANLQQLKQARKSSNEKRKLDEARKLLETAITEQDTVWDDINWPSPAGFTPTVMKTTTDSDGRFKFVVPYWHANAELIVFAKANRLVGEEKENYWWMESVHLNGKITDVLLSNDNKDRAGIWYRYGEREFAKLTSIETPFEKYLMNYADQLDRQKLEAELAKVGKDDDE